MESLCFTKQTTGFIASEILNPISIRPISKAGLTKKDLSKPFIEP
jgi:hypothetical protein